MERLIKTSRGWISLALDKTGNENGWFSVTVFGDDGWEKSRAHWSAQFGAPRIDASTLHEFVAAAVGIEEDEARELSAQVLAEWRERASTLAGQREHDRARRGIRAFLLVTASAILLGAFVLTVLIWLVASSL